MTDGHLIKPRPTRLVGLGVSPGYAIGRAHFVDRKKIKVPHRHVEQAEIDSEIDRFQDAIALSEKQLKFLKARFKSQGQEHDLILEAHTMMLRDDMLVTGTEQLIREQSLNAEWALQKVVRGIKKVFDNIDDEYFKERRADIGFVADRLLRNLLGKDEPTLANIKPDSIVVAHDLSPADTAQMLNSSVLGFVTEVGGRTSHTAIMARSLELPAVIAIDELTEHVGTGDLLVVDGSNGRVHINPAPKELKRYRDRQATYEVEKAKLNAVKQGFAQTKDGHRILINGNIELPTETNIVIEHGAEGVGLYRTEFLYMNRSSLPSEDEQYACYREVVEKALPGHATIRTLDLGGDKLADFIRVESEDNPVMGLRAVRFCLMHPDIFRVQARALLRASIHGELRVMVPLISRLDEVRAIKSIFRQCRRELEAEGVPIANDIPFGIMIEVPSAALIAQHLAREVDFFSIGTNDLVQYTLAVDRGNPHVARLYAPMHPAMLSLISIIVGAARGACIDVSMCGEMAGDPLCLPIVIGLGLKNLSMNATSIPLIKAMVRNMSVAECESLVNEILELNTAESIENAVKWRLREMLMGTPCEPMLDALFDDPSMIGELEDYEG
ncbi:MAG: phosphoenolpyruvate--protein phosphotransferase [Myxococcota bacterium]|nr:phosphoenolpyruvate--protein phosphotransferase [Myxococcota bacterium]